MEACPICGGGEVRHHPGHVWVCGGCLRGILAHPAYMYAEEILICRDCWHLCYAVDGNPGYGRVIWTGLFLCALCRAEFVTGEPPMPMKFRGRRAGALPTPQPRSRFSRVTP